MDCRERQLVCATLRIPPLFQHGVAVYPVLAADLILGLKPGSKGHLPVEREALVHECAVRVPAEYLGFLRCRSALRHAVLTLTAKALRLSKVRPQVRYSLDAELLVEDLVSVREYVLELEVVVPEAHRGAGVVPVVEERFQTQRERAVERLELVLVLLLDLVLPRLCLLLYALGFVLNLLQDRLRAALVVLENRE